MTPTLAGVTLSRRLRAPQVASLSGLVRGLVRRHQRLRAFVFDASRLEGDGADAATLESLRTDVLAPLCTSPSRPTRLVLVGTRRVGQLALIGAVTLHSGAQWEACSRLEQALEPFLGSSSSEPIAAILSTIHNELAPLGMVSQVRGQLGENPKRSLPQVAHELGLAPRTVQRSLADAATTFAHERTNLRVELAANLLATTDEKVQTIAQDIGYRSPARFIEAFRSRYSQSPSAFRARRRSAAASISGEHHP